MNDIVLWYREGGPFIVPLALTGLAGLAMLAQRAADVAVRSRVHSRPFMERVISLARAGKRDEALALCAEHQAALPDVGLMILRSRSADAEELHHIANAATLAVLPALTRRREWLPAVARIAILIGLLGGVANLHAALGDGRPMSGADGGLRFALRPVAAGLLTAIPLIAGHTWITATAEKLAGYVEEFSVRLINALTDRADVRLGHRD
jgi:biopolymer transport protein ExbB/TolQ